jgi:small subunit ribosomal protein S9
MVAIEKNLVVSGKRKTSVAKATIKAGSGKVTINKKPIDFFPELQKLELNEPLFLAKELLGDLKFDIFVAVTGGGLSSRVEASRLAIARAILAFTKSEPLRTIYLDYDRNLVVADIRRKEAYKPGDSKARSRRQSSKR